MTIWQRIAREPNAILGLIVGIYGLLVAFDVLTLNAEQVGAVTAFAGAVVFLLRWLTTPAGEVVAQQPPNKRSPVAGGGSDLPTGTPVQVTRILGKSVMSPSSPRPTEKGSSVVYGLLVILIVLAILAVLPAVLTALR